ncbi:TolB family protein [Miltoncostaea marina]|uniref:TolB family protein n=1 Tax=Miltoncostaea marina TaxID=2843215 RepID=UPI001C3E23AF|nr:hypothetical protein [Miltoncostaea marina]
MTRAALAALLVAGALAAPPAAQAVPASGTLVAVRGHGDDADLVRVAAAGGPVRVITGGRGIDGEPSWSPDGRRIAFSRTTDGGRRWEIHAVTADGRRIVRVTRAGGFALDPAWSPDGRLIAFAGDGGRIESTGCSSAVWVVRPDGTGLRRLLRDAYAPAWSPEGRRLAVTRDDARGRPRVLIAPAAGGRARPLTAGAAPSWSPDGRRLVVARDGDLYLVDADGTGAYRLTRTPWAELDPAWSPDGRWIAVYAVRHGRQDLYLVPAAGGPARRITRSGPDAGMYAPAWRPEAGGPR